VRLTLERGAARANAEHEFKTLAVLHEAGLPVPRPLLLDVEALHLGRPCLVMEHAGSVRVRPRNRDAWLLGFARALAEIHGVSLKDVDLSHLAAEQLRQRRQEIEQRVSSDDAERLASEPLVRDVISALDRESARLESTGPCLVHNDYWAGNVLWRRGRVSAVIDWSEAVVGDRAADVGQFSFELALIGSPEDAQRFTELYAECAGAMPANLRFVELLVGLAALAKFDTWFLPGYVDLGLKLTAPQLLQRVRDYVGQLLESVE
jgi:aminoglycoside phosphotransferase (APT) family kinase protein